MKDHDLVLMQNHGEVTVGKSYEEAIQRAVFFELACRIIVVGGDNIAPLSDDQAETLTML
jgi:ribulose-5-phosphate 4-epimerase/fuculose-1-phosphate aldolase